MSLYAKIKILFQNGSSEVRVLPSLDEFREFLMRTDVKDIHFVY